MLAVTVGDSDNGSNSVPDAPRACVSGKDDTKFVPSEEPFVNGCDECAICLHTMSDAPTCTLPCNHVLHVACVENLRVYCAKAACPLCRADLPPGPDQLFAEATRRHARWGRSSAPSRAEQAAVLQLFTGAAEQGHAQAQYVCGYLSDSKDTTTPTGSPPPDYTVAARWYREAADQGHAGALFNLSLLIERGRIHFSSDCNNTSIDVATSTDAPSPDAVATAAAATATIEATAAANEAWRLCRCAAEQGLDAAQVHLGAALERGKGVFAPPDFVGAVWWYRQAAAQGNAQAQLNLGSCYAKGVGVAIDTKVAKKWFRKASHQGLSAAHYELGLLCAKECGKKGNVNGAVPRSNLLSSDNAHLRTATLAEAFACFKQAAEQGHAKAQYQLGKLHRNGACVECEDGLPREPALVEAAHWFHLAALQGLAEAQLQLGHLCLRKDDGGSGDGNENTPVKNENGSGNTSSTPNQSVDERVVSPVADAVVLASTPSSPQQHLPPMSPLSLSPGQRNALPRGVRAAAQWYRAAAKQGLAPAQYNYAVLLARGKVRNKGTKESRGGEAAVVDSIQEHAAKWFRKAAAQGHAAAQRHLDESTRKCLVGDFELTDE